MTIELDLDDRIEVTAPNQAFITLKDHKPNSSNKQTCPLINPSKPELRNISKKILEKANQNILAKYPLNQWKNTNEVTKWFNGINEKSNTTLYALTFMSFTLLSAKTY